MNYAIIENGLVVNIIVGPLPAGMEGIDVSGRPVAIGDQYSDGVFTREGEPVLTDAEHIAQLEAENAEYEAALVALEEALDG